MLTTQQAVQKAIVNDLRERLEERTNRSLRNTLVFKGVPSSKSLRDKETWEETSELLAEHIERVSGKKMKRDEARAVIERAHRGRFRDHQKVADIYVAITDWREAEKIKDFFKFRKNAGDGIFCDQKYGPLTSWRRNEALKLRKDLKDEGKIVSGYVKYPAKLFVKKTEYGDYDIYRDFSNDVVPESVHKWNRKDSAETE